jgi:hypothetical protein
MQTVKQQIFDKLAEIEALLEDAECDGLQLAELACWTEVGEAFNTLTQAVDYYVD